MSNQISLSVANGHAVTSSIHIAEVFHKRHGNVLRRIQGLDCSEHFRQLNFESTLYKIVNPEGGKQIARPSYNITRDGFVFVAMGFTGAKAASFKEAYIEAFNRMEEKLFSRKLPALTISPEQQHQIKELVREAHLRSGVPYGTIYHRLYQKFQIPRYQDLPARLFQEAVQYLGGTISQEHDQVLVDRVVFNKLAMWAKSAKKNADNALAVQREVGEAMQKLLRVQQQCMTFAGLDGAPIFSQAFDPKSKSNLMYSSYGLGADEAPGAIEKLLTLTG